MPNEQCMKAPRLLLLLLGAVLAALAVVAALVFTERQRRGTARDYVVRLQLPPPGGEIGLPRIEGPLDASRPLVVIDAGHGGHDPGAVPTGEDQPAVSEKAITLALAAALRQQLLAGGGIRVALTRDRDRYLLLAERAGMARRMKADLFISLHADSADNPAATGATVYTLSESGSSEEADRLAAAENRADTVNGADLARQSDVVSAILVDLAQRETAARSGEFARLVVREGRGELRFRTRPIQSAAFVVLKSADVPSALLEAGYLSNTEDAAGLASDEWQQRFASVTARAIRVFFARGGAQ